MLTVALFMIVLQEFALDAITKYHHLGHFNNIYFMYTYGWFKLLFGRNQHNIVKQSDSNKNQSTYRLKLKMLHALR